jgi:hypothetical protein
MMHLHLLLVSRSGAEAGETQPPTFPFGFRALIAEAKRREGNLLVDLTEGC